LRRKRRRRRRKIRRRRKRKKIRRYKSQISGSASIYELDLVEI
jgi:hypothetical protein